MISEDRVEPEKTTETEPVDSNTYHTGIFLGLLLGTLLGAAAVALAGLSGDRERETAATDLVHREQATLSVIRLGMLDWMAACAWEAGRASMTSPAMFRACVPQLGIGEPAHPERRAGK